MGDGAKGQSEQDQQPASDPPGGLSRKDIRKLERGEATTAVWSYLEKDYDAGIDGLAGAVLADGMPKSLTSSREYVVWLLSRAAAVEAKRKPLRRFWFEPVVCLVIFGVIALMVVTWQKAGGPPAPDATIPGFEGAVSRSFRASAGTTDGTSLLRFGLAGFDTSAHAEEGMQTLIERLLATPGFEGLEPISAPPVGSDTAAYAGQVELRGVRLDAAVLFVRDGDTVHVMEGYGTGADALQDLSDSAARLFGLTGVPPSPADVDYKTGERWNRLPKLEHVPSGFVLAEQEDGLAGDLLVGIATPVLNIARTGA